MQGYSALWIPGMDHAGFETQYVYEKNLAKEGKSRMDFDRKTLYQNVFDFVKNNSGLIYSQFI
jgi:valyl-tRNA synthetase